MVKHCGIWWQDYSVWPFKMNNHQKLVWMELQTHCNHHVMKVVERDFFILLSLWVLWSLICQSPVPGLMSGSLTEYFLQCVGRVCRLWRHLVTWWGWSVLWSVLHGEWTSGPPGAGCRALQHGQCLKGSFSLFLTLTGVYRIGLGLAGCSWLDQGCFDVRRLRQLSKGGDFIVDILLFPLRAHWPGAVSQYCFHLIGWQLSHREVKQLAQGYTIRDETYSYALIFPLTE